MPGIKVIWHPNLDGRPGSHFYVQFRRKGENIYERSIDEFDENFVYLRGLDPNQLYQVRVVAVDGEYSTESAAEEVIMYNGELLTRQFLLKAYLKILETVGFNYISTFNQMGGGSVSCFI